MVNGDAKTPTDALKITSEAGYDVEKLTPTTNNYEIIWNQETNQVLIFDVNSFTNGAAFTKYQGSQKDNSNNKLFTNKSGFIVTGNADYDSGSYIKFSSENETKNPFSIYFNGYYE